ncbi:LLM class flavin-dependent oxidoreductase [Zhihengliuella salsuginis]|uniref:Monooxygenase n=1 Tax=Zhihengliuella salsuginis TaxID=578222 RepID=A0ABQ3GFD3_9MICC|nr:LLM class flavin-dependent oxidoreductase [Zhihengliuella salsuginis]GHD03909.1 monooxygenase [Zhihengliuella salsuginis]
MAPGNDGGARQVHLNLFAHGCGHHAAAWRAPASSVDRLGDIGYWEQLARTAERGLFDAIFLADGQSAGLDGIDRGPRWFLEPITTLTALARATERIGLVTTVSSTFWNPFNAARQLASLDHISAGRAGVNVVTSMTDAEAHNHSMAGLPGHEERYARAAEFVTVLSGLWDSWPAESIVADRSGTYTDAGQLNPIDHRGRYFDVAGPLNVPQPPQGRPVVFQAGASEPGRDLAARCAEGIYAVAWDLESARAYRRDIRSRVAEHGRDPDGVAVMPGLVTYVASSEQEAKEIQRGLNELLPVEDSLRQLAFFVGADTSGWELDAPVPDLPPLEEFRGPQGRYATVLRIIESTRPTVRELLGYLAAGGGHATFIGTPEQIADEIERWVDGGGADGFNLMPPSLPEGIDDFVDLVVPVLQERGRFRRAYEGRTLRSHLLG